MPYSCRQLLDNPAMYPGGWTYRAFFAPRGDRINKRPQQVQQDGKALLQEQTPAQQERWQKSQDKAVAREVAAKMAEAAVTAAEMEVSPA